VALGLSVVYKGELGTGVMETTGSRRMSFAPLRMTRVVVFACQHLALPPLSQKRVKDGAPIFVAGVLPGAASNV
jgi:hypothetical protein